MGKIKHSNFEGLHDTLNAYIFHQVRKTMLELGVKHCNDFYLCYVLLSDMDDFNPRLEKIREITLNAENKVVLHSIEGDEFVEGEWDFRDLTDLEVAILGIEDDIDSDVDVRASFGFDLPYTDKEDFEELSMIESSHYKRCIATIFNYLKKNGTIAIPEDERENWCFSYEDGGGMYEVWGIELGENGEFIVKVFEYDYDSENEIYSSDLNNQYLIDRVIDEIVFG